MLPTRATKQYFGDPFIVIGIITTIICKKGQYILFIINTYAILHCNILFFYRSAFNHPLFFNLILIYYYRITTQDY